MIKKVIVKACLCAACLAAPAGVGAVDWTVANQSTIGWDAVTKTATDGVIPPGDTVKYEIYIVKESSADKNADKIKLGETEALTYTITFNQEGRWLTGIRAARVPEVSPDDIMYSQMVWSDSTDVILVPVPFGFIYYEPPASPGGFGPK